tara:strand:+ start:1101 stop:1421 length:321 start_codon:yes stop_codon:yes gene_type:complete
MSDKVSTEEIQAVARELQLIRGQMQSVSSQVSELTITLEALESQDPVKPVYRSFGNILLEVEDRKSLMEELSGSKNTLEEHLTRLVEREESLRGQYENLANEYEKE